jgi:hypothetical protein
LFFKDKEPDGREHGGGPAATKSSSNKRSLTGNDGGYHNNNNKFNNKDSSSGGVVSSLQSSSQQQQPLADDVTEELAKRARPRHAPTATLDRNEPSISVADRAYGGLMTPRQQQHAGGDAAYQQARLLMGPPSSQQDQALEEELLELRERQRLLLSRSMLYGGGVDSIPSTLLSSSFDPLARYRQLDQLSASGSGGGGTSSHRDGNHKNNNGGSNTTTNNNFDLNPSLMSAAASLDQQRLDLMRGTALGNSGGGSGGGGGGQHQDSAASSRLSAATSTQDSVIASLRQELELKERRAQMEALLVHREEELLLRRLEQERDASLMRLRRQEAMLVALRQCRPMPDLNSGAPSSIHGGRLHDAFDLGGQSDQLRRQAELSSLLGSRSMLNAALLDSVSLLGSSRFGQQTDSILDSSAGRKGSFDHDANIGHGKKDD